MATWRGHGGQVTVMNTNVELGVSKWTLRKSAVLANKTNSKSAGHKQRQKTVRDSTFTIEMPWDDETDPEDIGFFEGETIKVVLMKGESGWGHSSDDCIIESVEITDDEDEDIVRLVVTGYSNKVMTIIRP